MYSATLNIPKKIGEFVLPTEVFVAVNTKINCIGFLSLLIANILQRKYPDKSAQMEGYANVMCPASQMFECEEEELKATLDDLHAKFDDEVWLDKNIYPYV